MAVNYENAIEYYFDTTTKDYIDNQTELPDTCPVCKQGISPSYILLYQKFGNEFELLCGCPRNDCRSLFIAEFRQIDDYNSVRVKCYPSSKEMKDFPNEIIAISTDFVEIYNQAHHAEQEDLSLICGVGYR